MMEMLRGSSVVHSPKLSSLGDDNALLFQVFFPEVAGGGLLQSQLTTLTGEDDGIRTRTAQSFAPFTEVATGTSFYRERRVSEEEFYATLTDTIAEYNILESDLCFRDGFTRLPVDMYTPGYPQCVDHLQQSFLTPFEPLGYNHKQEETEYDQVYFWA